MDNEKDEKDKNKPNVQAKDGSIAIGEFRVGGNVNGNIHIGDTHEHIEQATDAKNQEEFRINELKELKAAILDKIASLQTKVVAPPVTDKPYHLRPLALNEGNYLLGRADVLKQLRKTVDLQQATFLIGRAGMGRTSLLQAGLMPILIREGDLPVLVHITSGKELDLSIRRSILTRAASMTYLKERTDLAKFLEHATEAVPENKRLVLLLDGFENLFELSTTDPAQDDETEWMRDFISAWELTQTNQRLHWVFSIDQGFKTRLTPFQPDDILEVSPLDRDTAATILVHPEQGGLKLEETDLIEIVNDLGNYRDDIDGASINPSELQVVIWGLLERDRRRSASEIYREREGVNGIFQQYLESTIDNHFIPELRSVAWQILTFLKEEYGKQPVSWDWIKSKLDTYGFETNKFPDVMRDLREHHLISAKEENYELANVNLKWGIQKWLNKQSLLKEAHDKSIRQLENIRASALRGMLAGGLGFGVFRWMVGAPIHNLESVLFLFLLYAPIGGLTGLLLTFFNDVFIARYRGVHPMRGYLLSIATGAVMFGLALAIYVYLAEAIQEALLPVFLAAIVGGTWGATAGLGIAWVTHSPSVKIGKITLIAGASAIILYLFNFLFPVLNRAPDFLILGGGFLFPFVILMAVLFWKPSNAE